MREIALGLDVGGTKTAAALVTPDGAVLTKEVVRTPAADGPGAVLDVIRGLASGLVARARNAGLLVAAVGVGTAGTVDHERGVVTSATENLPGWAGMDLAGELQAFLGLPVSVDNDVNVVALGEVSSGAIGGSEDALYVTVGTGVGGAILHAGDVYRGASGTAGEIGHLLVDAEGGRRCSCGGRGHLEAYASGPAIARTYAEATGLEGPVDLREVAEKAHRGDPAALGAISTAASLLGRTLGGAVNLLDPDVLVIGGGVAEIGEPFWSSLRGALAAELLPGPSRIQVRSAMLGADAGVVGAARLGLLEARRQGSVR
jgi:glucokinase